MLIVPTIWRQKSEGLRSKQKSTQPIWRTIRDTPLRVLSAICVRSGVQLHYFYGTPACRYLPWWWWWWCWQCMEWFFFSRFLHNEGFPPLGTRGCYQLEVIFWRNFSLPAGDDAVLAFKQFILMIMMIFMNFNEHNMRSCTRSAMFMGFATATVCTAALMLVCWFLEVLGRSYRR